MRTKIIALIGLAVLAVLGFITFQTTPASAPDYHQNTQNTSKKSPGDSSTSKQSVKQPSFDKNQYSLSDPTSLWVVVNKQRPLSPKTYLPANLVVPNIPLRSNITSDEKYVRSDTAAALEQLSTAAKTDGLTINLQSGYRSYNFQVALYNRYVSEQGQSVADTQSARPGFSEHQTGLAADVGGTTTPSCNVEQCFAGTPEGKWIAAHAYEYGFVVRYPLDKDSVTGYEYEPWHLRYVGKELASEMHRQNIDTIETFFSLPAAPSYQ